MKSPWDAKELRKRRLEIILKTLQGRSLILIIDETGDKKKGKSTDYVKRQYLGNLGKIETGIVAVTAYGYFEGITFPLTRACHQLGKLGKEKPKRNGEKAR